MAQTPLPPRPRLLGSRQHFAIVASLYNERYVDSMLASAQQELRVIAPDCGMSVFRVPGAYEIPLVVDYVARSIRPAAVLALGVVIRGETGHADLIMGSVTEHLQRISRERLMPVIHEVLLVDTEEQAAERCQGGRINRGVEAARAAANMAELLVKLRRHHPVAGDPGVEDVGVLGAVPQSI